MSFRRERCSIAILLILSTISCAPPRAGDFTPAPSPVRTNALTPTFSPLDLYRGGAVRVIDRSWTVEDLLARSALEQSPVWTDGEELTFFYQGEAEAVHICCGIQLPMQRVEDSDVWALTVHVDELSQAVISYAFIPYRDGRPIEGQEPVRDAQLWRGPKAPPAPKRAETLQGQISTHVIHSDHLGEPRDLTVYLPPGHSFPRPCPVVYAADGQSVDSFASILDPQIVDGSVPAVILVGAHSGAYEGPLGVYEPSRDLRAQEYLLGENPERFEAHERFFVDEVSDWAEKTLGASTRRQERALFGCSNGAAFAVSMGIRHPERYGAVIAFSVGEGPQGWGMPAWAEESAPRHYLVAGTLEPFRGTTARWAAKLARLNVEHVHLERVCGHDLVMWEEAFASAVAWAFQDQ